MFPEWFLKEIYEDSTRFRIEKGVFSKTEKIKFCCGKGHIYTQRICDKINLNTLEKNKGCPVCHKNKVISQSNKDRKKLYKFPQWFIDELVTDSDKQRAIKSDLSGIDVVKYCCPICGLVYENRVSYRIHVKTMIEYRGCPSCSNKRGSLKRSKLAQKSHKFPEWFLNELVDSDVLYRAQNGLLSGEETVEFRCPEGHVYKRKVFRRIKIKTMTEGDGCPTCGRKIGTQNRVLKAISKNIFPQWFIDELYKEEDKQRALDSRISTTEILEFICPKGHIYTQRVGDHINISSGERRYSCPTCGKERAKSSLSKTLSLNRNSYPEWFINDLYYDSDKEKAKNRTLVAEDVVTFICSKGHIYTQRVGDHIKLSSGEKRYGCRECSIEDSSDRIKLSKCNSRPEYPKWFIDLLYKDDDKEKARNRSLCCTDVVDFKCSKGHIYRRSVGDVIRITTSEQVSECPYCRECSSRSFVEKSIENFIKSLNLTVSHSRSILPSRKEIDIFIPEKNIGIEYNGSFYHKTLANTSFSCKPKTYHKDKFLECKSLGIHLINIFDVDWNNHKEKIKQYLKDLLFKKDTIYARKCSIAAINNQEANYMYSQYHLLGTTSLITCSYGLYYNEELVSCMSFQQGRYKDKDEPIWALTRFVTKSGLSIVGGASKLLDKFEKEIRPNILVSYSDNDYFLGDVYGKLGFSSSDSSIRYYWFLNNKELKRETCQLKYLSEKYPDLYKEAIESDASNKEDYIMLKLGAFKVYRSGYTKWVKSYQ